VTFPAVGALGGFALVWYLLNSSWRLIPYYFWISFHRRKIFSDKRPPRRRPSKCSQDPLTHRPEIRDRLLTARGVAAIIRVAQRPRAAPVDNALHCDELVGSGGGFGRVAIAGRVPERRRPRNELAVPSYYHPPLGRAEAGAEAAKWIWRV
jgi:hypothetical protein